MKGLILAILLCGCVLAEDSTTKWQQAVEEILASVTLGPLKEDFSPKYLAQRTRSQALRGQTNRFRAKVATALIECIDTKTTVCPGEHVTDHAVESVVEELKQHGFAEVYWLKNRCVVVHVPAPRGDEVDK